ncbi:MAG: hypothetical protein LBH88_02885 [Candidatus Methanoplasma sp.]|jgi:hypothetical protein|nr:hypothetical protein [Candidatus Methanoplasma sp.]
MIGRTIAFLLVGILAAAGTGVAGGYMMWHNDGNDGVYDEGYDAGFTAGNAAGYDDGLTAGSLIGSEKDHAAGYDSGYLAGHAAGTSGNNAIYNSGYKDGYGKGYDAGYNDGAAAGYEDGYTDGFYAASTTYWFYIDYGNDSELENGWLSARSSDATCALKTALDDAEIAYSISGLGAITSIGDARNYDVRSFDTVYDEFMEFEGDMEDFDWRISGYKWYYWFWSTSISYAGTWIESDGYVSQSAGVFFYIGFSYWEWDMWSSDPLPTVDVDPRSEISWKNAGPFA